MTAQVAQRVADAPISFRSRGVVLAVGDDETVLAPARALAARLKVVAFAPGLTEQSRAPNLEVIGGRIVSVSGHLGNFRAQATVGKGETRDMGLFSANRDGLFDLVLDLRKSPLITAPIKPTGYFAPRTDEELGIALRSIPQLVGDIEKPRFLAFDGAFCAHSRQGLKGCRRCIEVCNAGAIRSDRNGIAVDPYLCTGCAACSLACPSGAVSFARPSSHELEQRVSDLLSQAARDGFSGPALLVHSAKSPSPRLLQPTFLTLEVPELPAFGDDLWLHALAAGASVIFLIDDERVTGGARKAICDAIGQAGALAAAAGCRRDSIRLIRSDQMPSLAVLPRTRSPISIPGHGGSRRDHKRARMLRHLESLSRGAKIGGMQFPERSSFGSVRVQTANCTVCGACANLCPTGALAVVDSARERILELQAAACIQCGLCVEGCGENAIALAPYLSQFGPGASAPQTLARDSLLQCARCGSRFTGRRFLEAETGKSGVSADLRQSLYTCRKCRATALFRD